MTTQADFEDRGPRGARVRVLGPGERIPPSARVATLVPTYANEHASGGEQRRRHLSHGETDHLSGLGAAGAAAYISPYVPHPLLKAVVAMVGFQIYYSAKRGAPVGKCARISGYTWAARYAKFQVVPCV